MSAMHRILFCRSCGNSFVPHIKTSQILSQRLSTQAATRKQSPQSAYTPIWQHQPVLFDKTLRALGILDSQLEPNRPRVIVDATFGNGGHTGGILGRCSAMIQSMLWMQAWPATLDANVTVIIAVLQRMTKARKSLPSIATRSRPRRTWTE
jgi:hypothetical protein